MFNGMRDRWLAKIPAYAPVVIMGIVVGLSVAVAIVSYREYTRMKSDLITLRLYAQRFLQRSLLMHGEVVSVDPQNSTISVMFRSQFVSAAEPTLLLLHVGASTTIAREDLLAANGAYAALSDVVPGTLADIVPGMRIAVLLENLPDVQRIEARVILFGNPL